MSEMCVINGKNKLKPEMFSKLLSNCNASDVLTIYFTNRSVSNTASKLTCTKDTLAETLFSETISTYVVNNEDEVSILSDAYELEFSGSDYKYWNETSRRRNKIIAAISTSTNEDEVEVVKTKHVDEFHVHITSVTNSITEVSAKIGTKKEVIEWLNTEILKFITKEPIEYMLIKINDYDYMTLKELAEKGIIVL